MSKGSTALNWFFALVVYIIVGAIGAGIGVFAVLAYLMWGWY